MKVFILTEGGMQIGFGHITRCLALSQAFEEKKIVTVFFINGDVSVDSLLEGKDYQIIDWLKCREEMFRTLEGSDIVVIDSYLADLAFYTKVRDIAKVPIYFDDTCRIEYPRGIVVNATVGAEYWPYPRHQDVHYLLGSQYVPLLREFWDIPEKEVRQNLETVLVTFGGSDTRYMTPKILEALKEFDSCLTRIVTIGNGFDRIQEIEKYSDRKTRIIHSPGPALMRDIMIEADVAVSAGGQTLHELARACVPTVAVAVADNQAGNIKGFAEAGVIEYAGLWDDPDLLIKIRACLTALRAPEARRLKIAAGRRLIGSQGSQEIVAYAYARYIEEGLVVRRFDTQDIRKIYELSNEKSVRESSFKRDPIPWENHKSWFQRRLADSCSLSLAVEVHGDLVGQVRFEVQEGEAVISISVDKGYRGFGLGKIIMQKALAFLKDAFPSTAIVRAQIRSENTASMKFFESCGFHFSKDFISRGQNAVEYIYAYSELGHED